MRMFFESFLTFARMSIPRKVMLLLAFITSIWASLLLLVPEAGQNQLFFCSGTERHCFDYFNAKAVSLAEHPYLEVASSPRVGSVQLQDQCYPALTYLLLSALPETFSGAMICQIIGVVILLVGATLFFRRCGVPSLLPTLMLLASSQVLFSLEVANTIIHAVGAVFIFLAWYDSESRTRRVIAAFALAFAVALKITPVFLGLVYLLPGSRINWKDALVSGIFGAILLITPFVFFGHAEGFFAWVRNAGTNSGTYALRNGFGWYGLVASLFDVLGYNHSSIHTPLRVFSSAFALLLVFRAFVAKGDVFARICLLVMGMLFFPPTMMCYTLLYAIPLFVVGTYRYTGRTATSFAVCWFFSCVPLQIPLLLGSLNSCLVTASTLDLCFVLWKLAGGKTA